MPPLVVLDDKLKKHGVILMSCCSSDNKHAAHRFPSFPDRVDSRTGSSSCVAVVPWKICKNGGM